MFNFLKKKTEGVKEEFLINNQNFSFDFENIVVKIEGNILVDLSLKASESVFAELCENDDFEFGYGLYAPEFYARNINLGSKKQVSINEKNIDTYETALYFMEHNDVIVNINIFDNWILITGSTIISDKEYPLVIKKKM
ncbi:MAG: hypothetical protein AB8B65_17905 [Kordia sp.]|uniref:hypothetical protein n=1 Tax=Kordia sp. TaxID=1965332 RepID=UPI00385D1F4B